LDEHPHRLERALDAREPDGQVADQGGAALLAAPAQDLLHAAHGGGHDGPSSRPNQAAAVSMSLSPRPERFTSSRASGPSSSPTCMAPTSACADSMAGMMPSVRLSRRNASMTLSSVA